MIIRAALFGLMALGLLGFGAVAWVSAHPPAQAEAHIAAPPPTVKLISVTQDLRPGTLLRAEDLAVSDVPRNAVPQDAMPDTPETRRELLGGMVRRSLAKNEILLSAEVMRPGDHGFLASVLTEGMRAVTVGVDAVSGSAGLISPGDRVDVILVQTLQDPLLPAGRRIAAQRVLTDVRVIATDQTLVRSAAAGSPARTVTLEVTGDQAERLEVAGRLGGLSLAVRAAEQPHDLVSAPSSPVFAQDVSGALPVAAPPTVPNVLHVFQGGNSQEFRF